jgi:peroxiredoxin
MSGKTLDEAYAQARLLDAPLAERLEAYAQASRELNKPLTEAVERLIGRLKDGGIGIGAPKEGDVMPSFLLPDHTGCLVRLEELLAKGPLVLTFARGHWCPYCRIAVSALAEVAEDVGRAAAGAGIIAIVPDRQVFAAKLKAEANAPFPILTDIDNAYALSLGLLFWVGEDMRGQMLARGADPAQSQGNDSWFVPVPATFVVAADARIVARHVDPDYRKRMELDAVLAAVRNAGRA